MGVDYYSCECCGEACYEEYVGWCESCGKTLCTDCLENVEDDSSPYASIYTNEEGEILSGHCPYCSGDKYDSDDLLNFIVEKYHLDAKTEIKDFKSQKK